VFLLIIAEQQYRLESLLCFFVVRVPRKMDYSGRELYQPLDEDEAGRQEVVTILLEGIDILEPDGNGAKRGNNMALCDLEHRIEATVNLDQWVKPIPNMEP
jgi:hypothetical protein